jgi:hypothetical protein
MTIVNYSSSIINKLKALLTVDNRVVIYDCHAFIVQATGLSFLSLGEPMNEEIIKVWKEATGAWIKEGYGQTETTLVAGTFKG